MTWINPEMADFQICQNNGVTAVRPNPNGRFADYGLRDSEKNWKTWLFLNVADPLDIQDRGIRVGDFGAFQSFKTHCNDLGITVAHAAFYVPCSNGMRVIGTSDNGESMATYTSLEVRSLRWDLPTQRDLERMAIQAKRFSMVRPDGTCF